MNFGSWTTSLSSVGGGYVESLSKNAKALAATAAQTGQGLAQNLVQRPGADPDSDGEQSPDESQMTPFEREIAQRKRDFERGQHLQRAKPANRNRKKPQSFSTMEGTNEDEEETAPVQEEQLDKNILAFVADSSDENDAIVKKGGGRKKSSQELTLKKKSSSTDSSGWNAAECLVMLKEIKGILKKSISENRNDG